MDSGKIPGVQYGSATTPPATPQGMKKSLSGPVLIHQHKKEKNESEGTSAFWGILSCCAAVAKEGEGTVEVLKGSTPSSNSYSAVQARSASPDALDVGDESQKTAT
eukprot:TRINITY_DN75411_c0_g1_i1.p1 TRINITY_DN75411_c0_g1~~TRINITY_DN75411_c0_g1_i1.p1  ORF type:complete len:106 (-),score=11.66 TRINITY_DN75411_c0_g1_i1:271-588(-)